ncbi:hypothetical protein SAMN05216259_101620 [Actinacidiphila guanduensis]|uniref:Uncharacterized protein n=1 Tax=Actinacidiphila guanduensis TaxID=310781 RepID=A0A1G9WED4_9ACTN|nr:hypothetical protein SAMN05216259_101620 [Actinacidiphila guanduensis]
MSRSGEDAQPDGRPDDTDLPGHDDPEERAVSDGEFAVLAEPEGALADSAPAGPVRVRPAPTEPTRVEPLTAEEADDGPLPGYEPL